MSWGTRKWFKKRAATAANEEKNGGKILMSPCQSESALKCLQSLLFLFLLKTCWESHRLWRIQGEFSQTGVQKKAERRKKW